MKKTLKQHQKEEFNFLKEFDIICKKNNIKYSLAFGTLLGAVRHNGFIPWDDDIDLMMEKKELDKILPELNKKYKIKDMINNKNKASLYAFDAMQITKEDMGNTLDIFIFEKTSNKKIYKMCQSLFMKIYTPISSLERGGVSKRGGGFLRKVWRILNKSIGKVFLKIKLTKKLNSLYIKLFVETKQSKPDYFIRETSMMIFNKKDIYPLKKIIFEKIEFPIINNYEKFLKLKYNKYWILPKEKDRVPLHFENLK